MQDLSSGLYGSTILKKSIRWKVISKSPMQRRLFQKLELFRHLAIFEYFFTSFGLSNAAQTFQCMIDHVVTKLEAVFTYMDDSRDSSLDRQTPCSFGSTFHCLGHWWSHHQLRIMHFCFSNFGNFEPHDFGSRFRPYGRTHHCNRYLPLPSLRTSIKCYIFSAW